MLTVDYEHCTGCEACAQRCPKHCISMVPGEFDFIYPEIDLEVCIDCHLCEKACPIERSVSKPKNQQAYAGVHKNNEILKASTSGGAFTALADFVLRNNGVVYGVQMDEFVVHHVRVEAVADIPQLRGSKYLQSRIGTAFQEAEADLKNGRQVLFTGTPCQIDGLKHFLGRDYDKLITVDIVCHGVGSQKYFDKFVETLKVKAPNAKEIKFRSKKYTGWSCSSGATVMENGSEKPFYYHENYYYQFFLQGDIYRKSCYSCKYANLDRPGDITLGDFWGVEKLKLPLNTYNGCSLVIVNTEKGNRVIEQIDELSIEVVNMDDAIKRNEQLMHPSELRAKREQRLNDYQTKTGMEIEKLYFQNDKKSVLKGKIKKMIPYHIKVLIRRGGYDALVFFECAGSSYLVVKYNDRRAEQWLVAA